MGYGSRVIALVLLVTGTLSAQPQAPQFGTYYGVLRHPQLQRDQLAKLDLIPSREDGGNILLKAVLTLHLGDFTSGEYVGYHYDNVRYHVLNRTLVFDQKDQPIKLRTIRFDGDEIVADVRSSFSGGVLSLTLRRGQQPQPELPLIEPVWGEYQGRCRSFSGPGTVDTSIQLYPYRSADGAIQVGRNPYRPYKVRGLIGQATPQRCLSDGDSPYCVWGNVEDATFNFFRNEMALYSNVRNMICSAEPDGLKCDSCEFLKRVSAETKGPRSWLPPVAQSVFPALPPPTAAALIGETESLEGEYTGYLHHEYLDVYQPASINLMTYPDPGLQMSATATLYFGEAGSPEALSYQFQTRAYPNPLQAPQFIFSNAEADVDAILQVRELGKGVVRGVWYSQLFGRVGTFEVRKNGFPDLPARAKKWKAISAQYESTQWDLNILVGLGTAAPNTENPFAPLKLGGWAMMSPVTARIKVTGGTFDFYTGRIGIEMEKLGFIGQRDSREKLRLKKVGFAVMSPLPLHAPATFRVRPEAP